MGKIWPYQYGKSSSKIHGLATGTLASVDDSLQCKVMHLWKLEKCPVEDKVLTANPFLRSEGEEEVRREGSTVGAGASGAAAMARGRRAVARGPRGGRGSRAAGLRGTSSHQPVWIHRNTKLHKVCIVSSINTFKEVLIHTHASVNIRVKPLKPN
jgi:hypothetical protein